MKKITQEEFDEAYALHLLWCKGTGGSRISFPWRDLSCIRFPTLLDLRGADLKKTYLKNVCFRKGQLTRADLHGAYLEGAILEEANLVDASLSGAYLDGAFFYKSNLNGTDLRRTGVYVVEDSLRRLIM